MMLVTAILWQIKAPALYDLYALQAGRKQLSPGLVDRSNAFLRSHVAFIVLFYSCLWTVKLSFLMFFRRLGSKVRGQNIWWWCILATVVLSWIACIADINYKCLLSSAGMFEREFPLALEFSANIMKHIARLYHQHVITIVLSLPTLRLTW